METKIGDYIFDFKADGTANCYYSGNACTSISNNIDNYVLNTVTSTIHNEIEKKPEVSPETRTKLDIRNGKIYARYFKDGFFTNEKCVISDIKDVTQYNNAIIVTFADGTKTKAVVDYEDYYGLEQGISICITKKLLGEGGSAIYNKLINRALKVKKQNEDAVKKAEEKKLEDKRRKEAAAAKKAQKQLKKREEQIEIQKEAYIRAMKALNKGEHKDKNKKKKFSKNP